MKADGIIDLHGSIICIEHKTDFIVVDEQAFCPECARLGLLLPYVTPAGVPVKAN